MQAVTFILSAPCTLGSVPIMPIFWLTVGEDRRGAYLVLKLDSQPVTVQLGSSLVLCFSV